MAGAGVATADVLRPGPLRRLRAMGWMIALFAVLAGLADLEAIVKLLVHRGGPGQGPYGALVGAGLACAAYVALVRLVEKRWPRELAWVRAPRDLAYGLALGAGLFALVFLILERLGAERLVPSGRIPWVAAAALSAATALVEELLFRAVVFRLLLRAFGPEWALAVSAVLFGATHLLAPHASPAAAMASAVGAGLMLGALYLATGRLWMPIGAHLAWNFAEGRIFGAAVSGQEASESLFLAQPNPHAPALLTGGAFGPEASVVAMLAGLAATALALRAWRRRTAGSAIADRDAEPGPRSAPAP